MIPHECTPYCDGQRCCIEPGTHTFLDGAPLGFLWPRFFEDIEIIRATICPDGKRELLNTRWRDPTDNDVFWLVTVREKETECSKSL